MHSLELTIQSVLESLHALANEDNRRGMERFGINVEHALGISMPVLRGFAREMKRETKKQSGTELHELAKALWETGFHEAQLLAILIENPKVMEPEQIERWVHDVRSWDVCDQLCSNLLIKNDYAQKRMKSWCAEESEFVRRVGIVMIAGFAVHDKKAANAAFEDFLPLLEQYAFDGRNFVKKAVNWSLRQIGKRNEYLYRQAIACAERIREQGTSSAQWIAADALREFARLPEEYFKRKKTSKRKNLVV